MLSLLPPELTLKIIYSLRAASSEDLQTLRSLPLISHRFAQLIREYRKDIIEYYTVHSVDEDGDTYYQFCGLLHRDNDLPAVIQEDGTQMWYMNGKQHRDNDRPAVIWANGTQIWFSDDQVYRANGLPTYVGVDGTQQWHVGHVLHRDNDLPAVIRADGSQQWWTHGKRIR
jgi:hypothetical protein